MKKEIIWNLSLLIFGIFIVLAFMINLIDDTTIPGWHSNLLFLPIGLWSKMKLGVILGVILILFRYLHIGILSIVNKDLRLIVMLLGYSAPILIGLIGLHASTENTINNIYDQRFPIRAMKNEISDLRKVGMFKSFEDK